jgi:asparagine synthase (glutamine-hydrolysing)
MCGIAGYWGKGSHDTLNRMGECLTHRGPDEGGLLEIDSVGLAHRRLSILDLSPTGHQPMQNSDKQVSLVFNGEIYNFKELREKFLKEQTFRGSSDTEVLLNLYLVLGDAFLKEVKGMFALALYDRNKNILLLAQDHMGKKPLYYAHTRDAFIFGSELKALRMHPSCPTEMDPHSIAQYLVYEYVPAPATIYAGVQKLMPGTYLTYNGSEVTHKRFNIFEANAGSYEGDEMDAEKKLFTLLEESVRKRMVADVPVGVFLSGGLDSSAVTFFAQRHSQTPVKTFSIGFDDPSFDESSYAREVGKVLKTEHYEKRVGPEDLQALISRIPRVLDEPMADSSIIPTLLLSEFTSSHVKVALGGDGADEIFWGYGTFLAHRAGHIYEHVPAPVRRGIRRLFERLPVSHRYMSFDFKVKKFLSGFETSPMRRNTYWLSAFQPEELKEIMHGDINVDTLLRPTDMFYEKDKNFWDSLQEEYLAGYLHNDILVKTDRASMAHGLEVRAPFLDVDVVQFALTLPRSMKYRGLTSKYILKKTMRGHLPDSILDRPKKGFNIPIGRWIQNDLRDLFTSTILDGALVKSGLFKRDGLAILMESHIQGESDNRKKIWSLMVLELWMREWYAK